MVCTQAEGLRVAWVHTQNLSTPSFPSARPLCDHMGTLSCSQFHSLAFTHFFLYSKAFSGCLKVPSSVPGTLFLHPTFLDTLHGRQT